MKVFEQFILLLFLFIYTVSNGILAYLLWFRFGELKTWLMRKADENSDNIFKEWGYIWINHASYKWFGRFITLCMFLMGFFACAALFKVLVLV